jgi:carbon storage regulator
MLVLTRKRDETIKIGSNIVIRVIKTAKGSVKIGIEAPDSVRIQRGEIATVEDEEAEDNIDHDFEEGLNESMYAALLVQS